MGSVRSLFNTLRKEILEVESKCRYCLLCMTGRTPGEIRVRLHRVSCAN